MKHSDKFRAHNSKPSLTSDNHIPKRQRLQAATIKCLNFETQNYLLGGDLAHWAAGSSHPLLSYAYTVIHKLKGCRSNGKKRFSTLTYKSEQLKRPWFKNKIGSQLFRQANIIKLYFSNTTCGLLILRVDFEQQK
jgi:hypothetical protein